MATGYDEHYAKHLYNQYIESEIQRGISEFPTESINENSDAFLAWQLQNQEFEGRRESDSIPLGLLSSEPSPGAWKESNKKKKEKVTEREHGSITIIDSDTECDAPLPVVHGKSEEEDKTAEETNSGSEENPNLKFQDRIIRDIQDSIKSSRNTVTESGALLAQPQCEDGDTSKPLTLTFYSDDVEEDSVPEVSHFDEVIASPMVPEINSRKGKFAKRSSKDHQRNDYQCHKKSEESNSAPRVKGSRQGRGFYLSSSSCSNDIEEDSVPKVNHLNHPYTYKSRPIHQIANVEENSVPEVNQLNDSYISPIHPFNNSFHNYQNRKVYNLQPRGKGSRQDRWFPNHNTARQRNESEWFTSPYNTNNSASSDEETQEKRFSYGFYRSNNKPKQRKKNFNLAKDTDGGSDSATGDDERIACQLGQELNKTQCEKDREFAQRLQDEEKNNLLRAKRMLPSRPQVQRNFPNLQMHDPYANRVIRHRTPFHLHEAPGGLHMLQTILGMEGQIMPPHLMQGDIDLNDYEALWELAERIGEAKGSGLSKRDLKSLNTTKFDSKSVENSEHTDCRICITDYADGDKVTSLPCGHRYHKRCIETWLRKKAECPICRTNIKTEKRN